MANGIRAKARLTLVAETDPDRAWAALASGSRSLLFQFSVTQAQPVSLGAVVTTADKRPLAWGDADREVFLEFWADAARMYVHETAKFSVWYSRTIGGGVITAVIDDLFGTPGYG